MSSKRDYDPQWHALWIGTKRRLAGIHNRLGLSIGHGSAAPCESDCFSNKHCRCQEFGGGRRRAIYLSMSHGRLQSTSIHPHAHEPWHVFSLFYSSAF